MTRTAASDDLVDALRDAIADESRVRTGDSDLDLHAADMTFHRPHRPAVVVYPLATDEVSAVLSLANELHVPVTPFGAGSSLEAQVIPLHGGISLDLGRMDRILEISPGDLRAVVQPGVLRQTLARAAAEHGLMFPVDPGADASLGGMAATNAGGTTTFRYGKMRPNVLALEAVLADGTVVRTGSRAAKTSAGYDLTGLLVGSEGTLAVITELTLRLYGIPDYVVAARISFPTVEAACRTASAAVAAGPSISRLELLDSWTVRAVNAYEGTSYPETPCLFVEIEGTRDAAEADLELIRELAAAEGATDVAEERTPDGRQRLWRARHSTAYALDVAVPGKKQRTTDVCVPVSQLAASVALARDELERLGLVGSIVGHAGDGNYHVGLMIDPDDSNEVARSDEFVETLVDDALARGGTCTGEHGVGAGKLGPLAREHGDLLPLMRGVKEVFDPNGILNPGKIVAAGP